MSLLTVVTTTRKNLRQDDIIFLGIIEAVYLRAELPKNIEQSIVEL